MGVDEKLVKDEQEYNEAWDTLSQDEGKGEEKRQPSETPAKDLQAEEGEKGDKANAEQDEGGGQGRSPIYGTVESMEKALKDTRSYASRLQNEVAELRKKIEAFERGQASAQDVKEQADRAEKAKDDLDNLKKTIYEDYPELEPLFETLIKKVSVAEETVKNLQAEKKQVEELMAKQNAIELFEREVKPKILEVHKDFDQVVQSKEYWQWAEAQSPALRYAAMDSPDPQDIIWAIGEFKKSLAKGDIQKIKAQESIGKANKVTHLQTLRGASSSAPVGGRKGDPQDYDDGWEEAGNILERQGLA